MTSLVASATMACKDLSPSALEHSRILHGFLNGRKDPKFCRDRNRQILVKGIDYVCERLRCNSMTGRLTEIVYQLPFVLQIRTVVASPRDILRTPKVYIDCITVGFQGFRGCE